MFSKLGKRFTVSNVLLVFAIVFAMTGGAYAAGKYVITSTKQISPKVLKSLVGKTGPVGKEGAPGKEGSAGKDGAPGKEGPAGKDGTAGKEGSAGAKGETGPAGAQGEPGEPGPAGPAGPEGTTGFTKTLPSGETETGTWTAVLHEVEPGVIVGVQVPISFAIPLKTPFAEGHVFVVLNCEKLAGARLAKCESVDKEQGVVQACPGTAAIPKATAGDLCIYQGNTSEPALNEPQENQELEIPGAQDPSIPSAPGFGVVGTTGVALIVGYEGPAGTVETVGTWAVTAAEPTK